VRAQAAFLDIHGLDTLGSEPVAWTDQQLKDVIQKDRIYRDLSSGKPTKKGAAQDTKRLNFLRNMYFTAKEGDLVVVPLGKGLDGEVAIGEFDGPPGALRKITVQDGDSTFNTWGRSVRWRATVKRQRFTHDLNTKLHNPSAFHLLPASVKEEIYLAAYGSFTYDDIYVALFPSEKERLSSTDQANIGIWFNAISVIYQREHSNNAVGVNDRFIELGLEEGLMELELVRNSPWSIMARTIGPMAFTAAALYATASEGKPLSSLDNMTVSAKTVAGAVDKCKVEIPPELAEIAKGLGHGRWDTSCKVQKRIQKGATVRPTGRLKPHKKKLR
jgi:hypothetical protein